MKLHHFDALVHYNQLAIKRIVSPGKLYLCRPINEAVYEILQGRIKILPRL